MITLRAASIDLDHHRALRPDGEVSLTQLEVDALRYLAERPGAVVSRAELEREVWRFAEGVRSEAVPVAMRRLRQKLGPGALSTVRGEGWRIELLDPPASAPRLPTFATPFVGREALLQEVEGRLLGDWRLVTLLGPGGVGKTRLATELAARWRGEVIAVSGVGLSSAAGLVLALSDALGLHTGDGPGLARALEARRRPLVLLDDADEVHAEVAPTLSRLAREAPRARLLVTSRVALGVPEEAVLEVRPFTPEQSRAFLIERCAHPDPEAEGAALDEIVAQLDGLPASLELYAGRAGLGLGALAAELRAGRQAPSLDASVERSWRGLDGPLTEALLAVSTYVGAFSLEEAVTACGDARRVAELRRRSLLQIDHQGRLFMLATVRRFCARQAGVFAAGRAARAGVLARAEALAADLSRRPAEALAGLRGLRPQLQELARRGEPEVAARAALICAEALSQTGPAALRLQLLVDAPWGSAGEELAQAGAVALARARRVAGAPAAEVARTLEGAPGPDAALLRGELAMAAGDPAAALGWYAQAIALAPPEHSVQVQARARRCATVWLQHARPAADVDADLAEALRLAELHGHPLLLPDVLRSAGQVAAARGDRVGARRALAQALQRAESQGQTRLVGELWTTLGLVWFDDALHQAAACFERALRHAQDHGDTAFIYLFQMNLGSARLLEDQPEQALALLDASASHLGSPVARQTCALSRAGALFALGRDLEAEVALASVDPAVIGGMYSPDAERHGALLMEFTRAEAALRRMLADPLAEAPALRALLEEARAEAARQGAVSLRAMVRRVEARLRGTRG